MLFGSALRRAFTAQTTVSKLTNATRTPRIVGATGSRRTYAVVKPLPPFMRKEAKQKKKEAKEAARKEREALPIREVNSNQGPVTVRTRPMKPFRPRELRRQANPISHDDPNRPRRKLLRVGDAERSQRIMFPNVQVVLVRNAPTPSRIYNPWIATFRCSPRLAKPDIVSYLQNIYGLEITSINTTTTARVFTRHRHTNHLSRTSNYKKAIVGLKQPFWYPEEKDRIFLEKYFGVASKKIAHQEIYADFRTTSQYRQIIRKQRGVRYGIDREARVSWVQVVKNLREEREKRNASRFTLSDEAAALASRIERQ